MTEGETPDEYQRRLRREQNKRYYNRHAERLREESREEGRLQMKRETQAAYRHSPRGQERIRQARATPEAKALDAAKHRRLRGEGSIPMHYPKEEGSPQSPYTLEREPFRPQGTQSELDRAARNREMVARNEAAKPYKEKGGRPKKGENAKLWWRKLW